VIPEADIRAARAALDPVAAPPFTDAGPVFAEPWHAKAFAMAVLLERQGVFTWTEWAEALGARIRRAVTAGDPDDGSTYYHHWLSTLETLIAEKSLATPEGLAATSAAWARAAARTPHGLPIELGPEDYAAPGA
jgi:nitrile hydratase accessory protein